MDDKLAGVTSNVICTLQHRATFGKLAEEEWQALSVGYFPSSDEHIILLFTELLNVN